MKQENNVLSPFSGCEWLTFPEVDVNVTRTVFEADRVASATLEMTALGYYEAYLNGTPLSGDRFFPPMSNYEKRDLTVIHMPIYDEMEYRIYYGSYDVTSLLRQGKNALAVRIGPGWYGQHKSPNEGMRKWGDNLLVFRLTLTNEDGTAREIVSSPANTKWKASFIRESSLYYGEYQDASLYEKDWNLPEYDDGAWLTPAARPAPEAKLCPADFPRDRVTRTIVPKVIYTFGDRKIYDIGEEASGYAVVTFPDYARTNEVAETRYADELNEDGSLNFHYCGGTARMQRDRFVFAETGVTEFYPHFTWHAARYIELTGIAEIREYRVVQTDLPRLSSFHSDNETLNWIFDAYVRTQQANVHGCVPSDCPHRERLGYTGDGQLAAAAVMTAYDAKGLYGKWMRDIADSQDIYNGHVEHTAPFYGGGGGPGGWGCAVVRVPYLYWKFYGDETVLKEYYPHIKKYLDYMESRCDDHIVMREEPKGWCLGDWCTPHNSKRGILIPEPYVNTYFYIRSLREAIEIAPVVGEQADIPQLRAREEAAAKAFVEKFMDPATGSFCNEVCGADAFAVDLGLGDERTLENLVKHYRELGTFDTGIFGTPFVVKVLFENGYGDDAYKLLANRGEVSFFHMMDSGATTLWEEWFNEHSSNHPMFGAAVEFLFRYILGIRQKAGGVGFKEIEIDPVPAPSLDWAEGSVTLGGKTVFVRVEKGRVVKKEIC